MKKIFLIIAILLLPLKVSALTFTSSLSGDSTIYSINEDEVLRPSYYTNMGINITNIESIGSFDMVVSYDKDLVGISGCHLFNYIKGGCSINDNRDIVYTYRYSDGYKEYFNNYKFYSVIFMPKKNTPSSGTTKITVSFKNAKDINQNPITINSVSKTFKFDRPGIKMSDKDKVDTAGDTKTKTNNTNSNTKSNNNSNLVVSDTKTEDKNSSDNYDNEEKNVEGMVLLEDISVEGYSLNFDKNKSKYKLYIKEDINSLNVKVKPLNDEITYKIIGADNLKENNHKVIVKVLGGDNVQNEYIIYAIPSDDKKQKGLSVFLNKRNIITAGCVILFIIVIIFLITLIKNRKMDKNIEKF